MILLQNIYAEPNIVSAVVKFLLHVSLTTDEDKDLLYTFAADELN